MEFNKLMQVNLTETVLKSVADENTIDDLQEFIRLQQLYSAAIKEMNTRLEILDDEFRARYSHNPIHHIEYRLKTSVSILQKLAARGLSSSVDVIKENVTDIAGIRVICNYVEDIYSICETLTSQSDLTLKEIKDYIKNPKKSGYRSLHIVVTVPIFLSHSVEQVPVEIQIRTIAMDFWASLEHQLKYKSSEKIPEDLRKRLTACAESIAGIDNEMQSIYREINSAKSDK